MEKHQTANENREDTANSLKQKTNQDFNGKKPVDNDLELDEESSETEVPGIGDDQQTESDEITMQDEDEERNDIDEYRIEEPTEEEPLNPKPQEGFEGDSDAEEIVNKENDDTQVF